MAVGANVTDFAEQAEDVDVRGVMDPGFDGILTPQALGFVASLHRAFNPRRLELLGARELRQAEFDAGARPDFLAGTAGVRDGDWSVSPVPQDLQNRRVEITGPVDRKMIINALNSGASVFMADFEDATTPTWSNLLDGQLNLRDTNGRTIDFDDPQSGRHYELADEIATLIVRPRGWHLSEKHVLIDGEPASASLFDFGLYFFHNAQNLIDRGSGPYFYLPKLESHLEARLWNDVFIAAQDSLGIPRGSIKATVLIETILAAFEMDEILYELREHSAGLNCGRWDYIFSFIKKFRNDPDCVLPDRADVSMTRHFMRSYSLLAIKTCHHRGAHAIGGMAAQIPIRNDEQANEAALAKVRADKEREAADGHDGTWVAHPGLVPIAREIFDRLMPEANQIHRQRQDVHVTAADLLDVPEGDITEAGLRQNINVGIRYLEAWLRGMGCVPLYNLMEDAATAEISRTQVWQWLRHGAQLDDGRTIDRALFDALLEEVILAAREELGAEAYAQSRFETAADLFAEMSTSDDFSEFLTLPAYDMIVNSAPGP
jgi:malate synthase